MEGQDSLPARWPSPAPIAALAARDWDAWSSAVEHTG